MIKKTLIKFGAAVAFICGICAAGTTANAATIDDVAATARRLGFPESVIQQGYNQYYADPDAYTPEDLDYYISYLIDYENEIKEKLGISTAPVETTATAANTDNVPSQTTTVQPAGDSDTDPDSPNAEPADSGQSQTDVRGGLTDTDFINMTLDEKRNFISTLSPDDQQKFFNTLSPDELKSIVKQLPTDDKAAVIDTFVKAGNAMGINVTVDNISDDTISMSMRNDKGELVDIASVGVIVEDTGYDYRGIFALSGALILAAAGGLWLVIRRCFGNAETGAENER